MDVQRSQAPACRPKQLRPGRPVPTTRDSAADPRARPRIREPGAGPLARRRLRRWVGRRDAGAAGRGGDVRVRPRSRAGCAAGTGSGRHAGRGGDLPVRRPGTVLCGHHPPGAEAPPMAGSAAPRSCTSAAAHSAGPSEPVFRRRLGVGGSILVHRVVRALCAVPGCGRSGPSARSCHELRRRLEWAVGRGPVRGGSQTYCGRLRHSAGFEVERTSLIFERDRNTD
jgi:hypothetical protein